MKEVQQLRRVEAMLAVAPDARTMIRLGRLWIRLLERVRKAQRSNRA